MSIWFDLVFTLLEILAAAKMNRLHGNFYAFTEGVSGAPKFQDDSLDNALLQEVLGLNFLI